MLSIFFVGLALSMDAFSVALSLGTNERFNTKKALFPIIVGVFHFVMPLIGNLLGDEILNIININPKIIVSIIFFYLAIVMYLDNKKEKTYQIESIISIFLLAFSVSLDSFSVGIGLSGITKYHFLSFLIFTLCSGSITYLGLIVGKYSTKYLKDKSIIFGTLILLILAIVNFCQIFIN